MSTLAPSPHHHQTFVTALVASGPAVPSLPGECPGKFTEADATSANPHLPRHPLSDRLLYSTTSHPHDHQSRLPHKPTNPNLIRIRIQGPAFCPLAHAHTPWPVHRHSPHSTNAIPATAPTRHTDRLAGRLTCRCSVLGEQPRALARYRRCA